MLTKTTLKKTFGLFISLFSIAVVLLGLYVYSYQAFYEIERKVLVSHLVSELSRQISGEQHLTIKDQNDIGKKEFNQIRTTIRRFAKRHNWSEKNIYTLQYPSDDLLKKINGEASDAIKLRYAIHMEDSGIINKEFPLSSQIIKDIVKHGIIVTSRYQDQYGNWISALATIYNTMQKPTGIAVVDFSLDIWEKEFLLDLTKIFVATIVVLLLISFIFFQYYKRYLQWCFSMIALDDDNKKPEVNQKHFSNSVLERFKSERGYRGEITRSLLKMKSKLEYLTYVSSYLPQVIRDNTEQIYKNRGLAVNSEDNTMTVIVLYMGFGHEAIIAQSDTEKVNRIIKHVHTEFFQEVNKAKGTMERITAKILVGYFQGPNATINAVRAGTETLAGVEKYWNNILGTQGTSSFALSSDANEAKTKDPIGFEKAKITTNHEEESEQELLKWQGIRMGVAMGPISLAELEYQNYRDVLYMGDAIEIALRLALQANPFEIIFSDPIFNEIFDYSELPEGFSIIRKGEAQTIFSRDKMKIYSIIRILKL